MYQLLMDLYSTQTRVAALASLSAKRGDYENMGPLIWNTPGIMTVLLQEIVMVYPYLEPDTFTNEISTRVCHAVAILQTVASHPDTQIHLVENRLVIFLFPFLNTNKYHGPYELLTLTALGVIGALVKSERPEIIGFLISTEITQLCLEVMQKAHGLCQTVALYTIQRIIGDDQGLEFLCDTYQRFWAISNVLELLVAKMLETGNTRLLKHIVRCYNRLADNPRARGALRTSLPSPLMDATFQEALKDDAHTRRVLSMLFVKLSDNVVPSST